MAKIYDKVPLILFNNGTKTIEYKCGADICEFDDSIELETSFQIDIDRGWIGNITFNLAGYEIEGAQEEVSDVIHLYNVLCIRRTIWKYNEDCIIWKYQFLKY